MIELKQKDIISLPVVDIFAGPGGLGEGFARAGFDISLSIEKDPIACNTLRIRKFFHLISSNEHQKYYFRFVRGEIDLEQLKNKSPDYWNKAKISVLEAELGNPEHEKKICESIETKRQSTFELPSLPHSTFARCQRSSYQTYRDLRHTIEGP